jgi:hypothetical protein
MEEDYQRNFVKFSRRLAEEEVLDSEELCPYTDRKCPSCQDYENCMPL